MLPESHFLNIHSQSRGVLQGAVSSPLRFNIILTTIASRDGVYTYAYADDVAFFDSDTDIQSLYTRKQWYICAIDN